MGTVVSPSIEPEAQHWGVLHRWQEHGADHFYVFGPLPTQGMAMAAMSAFGCDCEVTVVHVSVPNGLRLVPDPLAQHVSLGDPLLPDRTH